MKNTKNLGRRVACLVLILCMALPLYNVPPSFAATAPAPVSEEEAGPSGAADGADDATPPGDAAPPDDATPPDDAALPGDATPPGDAALPGDATPPDDATLPGDADSAGEADGADDAPPPDDATPPAKLAGARGISAAAGEEPEEGASEEPEEEESAIDKVRLIWEREIEIYTEDPDIEFTVLVDGEEAAFDRLPYFDFGPYEADPFLNIRLKEPLTIRDGDFTEADLGDDAAASITVVEENGIETAAVWAPYYTFYDQLNSTGAALRGNRGSRGLMWVWGNDNSRCSDSTFEGGIFDHIPETFRNNYIIASNPAYTGGTIPNMARAIDRTVGRSEHLVNTAILSGMKVVVVGNGESVYSVPELRHFYEPNNPEPDWGTRVALSGGRAVPIVVTTAEDTWRVKGEDDNTYEFMREFAKLFLEMGVRYGWSSFPLGPFDNADSYNSYKRLQESFAKSRAAGLWPGTDLIKNLENYFVYGSMIWFECLPESDEWGSEGFPINTRREILDYDYNLYRALAEVYGEWEYHVGSISGTTDSARRWSGPWYKHGQADNYTVVDGEVQPYEPLEIVETNLISHNQVELVFNREIKDLDDLRTLSNWELTWTPAQDATAYVGSAPVTYLAGQTYSFGSVENALGHKLTMEYYMWKTLTLKVVGVKLNSGFLSYEIGGFTQNEITRAFNSSLTIEQGYKPWFAENAYYRDLTPVGVAPMSDIGDVSGWMADTASDAASRTSMAVSQQVWDSQTPAQRAAKGLTLAKKIPREDFVAKASALEKGEYIRFDAGKGGFVAYDKDDNPLNGGSVRLPASINGSLDVTFHGSPTVEDWGGNELEAKTYSAALKPWNTQIMRSEKTGVYCYADAETKRSSLLVACDYWDYIFSGTKDNLGQRMADGFNFIFTHQNVKTGEFGSGGLEIMGYHNHMYMAPNRRSLYNAGPGTLYAEGLGYHVASAMEYSLLRDYTITRYKHESIMHHEGAHSVEYPGFLYFTDLNFELHDIYRYGQTNDSATWNPVYDPGAGGWATWSGNGTYSTYSSTNAAEYFATLSTYWMGTMRESVDGSVTGVWTAISHREELYEFDRVGYEFMKKIYYNGETYLDPLKVPNGVTALPGWDASGNSINDDVIKWGLSFPGTMNEDRADWGIFNEFKWISWSAPNIWDIRMVPVPGSGRLYDGTPNPDYEHRAYPKNYNPYMIMYEYNNSGRWIEIIAIAGEGGTVSGGKLYGFNARATLRAVPNSGFVLDGWYEDDARVANAGPQFTFNVTKERTLEARFVKVETGALPPSSLPTLPPVKEPGLAVADVVVTPPGGTAQDDAAKAAEDLNASWAGSVKQAGLAVFVHLPNEEPTLATLKDLPGGIDPTVITTMAILGDDGKLTPVPTRIIAGAIVVVLVKDAVLVPLNVYAEFTDLQHVTNNVRDEIIRAASYMIVQGFPDGAFRPGEGVTVQQAVTMILRASGVPVEFATAMATGAENRFISAGMPAKEFMTRIQAAQLIVNALAHFGLKYPMSDAEIAEVLGVFSDIDDLSGLEREALAICVKLGIFHGHDDGTMAPNGVLNRSQLASLAIRMQNVLFGLN